MYNKKNFYFYELICIFNCIVVILHCIINHIKFYIMKKFLFLFASMMLLGGNLVNAATTENSSTAKAENATEVVTLHLNFTVGDRIVYFSCPEWNQYGINEINKKFGYKHQELYSYILKFNFNQSSGILDYLNHKEFKLKIENI